MSNTDVSRLLGEMWRTATPSERAPYVEEEMVERGQYKEEIQSWRSSQAMEDTEKRTSHYDFPEKDKAPSSPPPKKRKEGEPRMFRPASSAIPSHGSQTGKHIDRRIFRSHIGHSVENRYPNFDQHRSVHPMYSYADVPRAMPMRTSESNVQRAHKVNNSLPAQTVTAGANKVQRSQPSHHFTQPVYRPAHLQPQQQQQQQHPHQRENPYLPPLRYSGSDVSQFDLFCDPEPPFNPRQLRPSSSHYFTDNSNPFP